MRELKLLTCASLSTAALLFAGSALAEKRDDFPRMPDGKPNLEGIWTSGTLTPYERPAELADKTHLTMDETEKLQSAAIEKFWAAGHKPGEVGRDNDAFLDDHMRLLANGQTSLVVFPPDGRYPLRAAAEQRRDFNLKSADTYESMSQWDRCITREPTMLFPVAYNNAYQIVQTSSHIVITAEMIHDARIIPMRGKGHIRM